MRKKRIVDIDYYLIRTIYIWNLKLIDFLYYICKLYRFPV